MDKINQLKNINILEINEYFKPDRVEPEIQEESSNKKYYILAGMIIFCCLAYYYSEDIKPAGVSLMEWIRSFRPGPGNDPNNIGDNIRQNIPMSFKSRLKRFLHLETEEERINRLIAEEPKWSSLSSKAKVEKADITQDDVDIIPTTVTITDKFKKLFFREDNLIDLVNETKRIRRERLKQSVRFAVQDDTQIASTSQIEPVKAQLSGLSEITSENFEESTEKIMFDMDKLFQYTETSFPKLEIQKGLYKLISNKIKKLSEVDSEKYNDLINNSEVFNKLTKFHDLAKELNPSDAYEEVVKATEQEQDHWSNRGNSPSPTIQSPVQQSINQVMSPDMFTYAVDDLKKEAIQESLLDNKEYRKTISDNFKNVENKSQEMASGPSRSELSVEEQNIEQSIDKGKQKEQLPQIEIDSGSDKSMDHYFKERAVTQEEVKTGFSSLFDSIKNRHKSSVTSSPEIAQVGLQPNINPSQDNPFKDTEINTTSKSFTDTLSSGFDRMMKTVTGSDDEGDIMENVWDDDKPTTSEIKAGKILKVVKTPDQDSSKLKSFLDDVKENASDVDLKEGKSTITKPFRYLLTQSEVDRRELEVSKNSETAPSKLSQLIEDAPKLNDSELIKAIKEENPSKLLYPLPGIEKHLPSTSNLFQDTMNLFDDEDDVLDNTPKDDSKEKGFTGKTLDDLHKEHAESIKNIVDKTRHLSPESLVEKMKEEFPEYNKDVVDYRQGFMKAIE
jgi:hypothetical protein